MTHDTTQSSGKSAPKRAPDKHDENGLEIGDPTPMEPPLGYRKTLSLTEQIQQQVRIAQLKILEDSALEETEEDADDFEVGEDFEPLSPHENEHMPTLANLKKRAAEINSAIEKRKLELAIAAQNERINKHKKKAEAVENPDTDPPGTND